MHIYNHSAIPVQLVRSDLVSCERERRQSNNSFVILADEPIDAGKHASLQTLDCFLSQDVTTKRLLYGSLSMLTSRSSYSFLKCPKGLMLLGNIALLRLEANQATSCINSTSMSGFGDQKSHWCHASPVEVGENTGQVGRIWPRLERRWKAGARVRWKKGAVDVLQG